MKYNSKLSTYKIKKIIKFFCVDVDVTKIAILLEINRNTIPSTDGIISFVKKYSGYLLRGFRGDNGLVDIGYDKHYLSMIVC